MSADNPDSGNAVDDAFSAALRHDAAVVPPEIPAPPRLAASTDPAAPHGRDGDGTPLAPYGSKPDGTPRIKPAGPGRGHAKTDAPRTRAPGRHARAEAAPSRSSAAAAVAAPGDYTAELSSAGYGLWMLAANCKGGTVGRIAVPDCRPYAHALNASLPALISSVNLGAQQNGTVRGWVEKLAGEGSWSWVLGLGLAGATFAGECARLRNDPTMRAAYAELSDKELAAFMRDQLGAELAEVEA